MSYTSIADPALYDGENFENLSDIPNVSENDEYYNRVNGDVMVFTNGSWKKIVSAIGDTMSGKPSSEQMGIQVLESSIFREKLAELALFQSITKQRYFQIKHLYKSEDVNNRVMAGNIVLELHKEMING